MHKTNLLQDWNHKADWYHKMLLVIAHIKIYSTDIMFYAHLPEWELDVIESCKCIPPNKKQLKAWSLLQ